MDAANLSLVITTSGMAEAKSGMEGLTGAADYLEKAFQRVIAAIGLWKMAGVIDDVTKLAARYETLGVVMSTIGNNAGYTGQQMKGFQSDLEKTGISMLAARQSLTMMAAAQLDLTKASQLGRVAQDAAVIGNVNSSVAFETLTRSITTGMAIEAHRLGIMVNYRKAESDYAASLGKTTSALTEQEKEHARLIEVLDQGAKRQGAYEAAMETTGKQALSMERYVENLKIKLGETFQDSYRVVIVGMTQALKDAATWVDTNIDSIKGLGSAMGEVVAQGGHFTKLLADIGGGADGASNSVGFLTRMFQGIGFLVAGTTDILRAFTGQFVQFVGHILQAIGAGVDAMTRLAGWGGQGGISKAGNNVTGWGANIMQPLNTGNSALTGWYDSVMGDKMASSHGPDSASEQARIKTAADAKAYDAKIAAQAAASKAAADYTSQVGKLSQSLEEEHLKLTEGASAAYAYRLSIDGIREADIKALVAKKDHIESLKEWGKMLDQVTKADAAWSKSQQKVTPVNVGSGLFGDYLAGRDLADPQAKGADKLASSAASIEAAKSQLQAAGLYGKALEAVRLADLKLRAQAGDTWAIIGQTVVETSSYAADALTRWSNNLDGLGVSWTTLGTTVRNVLADMVRQMEKAIIEQKLMQPLMNWASNGQNWINLFSGSGSGLSTSGVTPSGWTGMTTAANPGGSGGGSAPQASIVVNVNHDGSTSMDAKQQGEAGAKLAQQVHGLVNQWAVEQSRSGGILARA